MFTYKLVFGALATPHTQHIIYSKAIIRHTKTTGSLVSQHESIQTIILSFLFKTLWTSWNKKIRLARMQFSERISQAYPSLTPATIRRHKLFFHDADPIVIQIAEEAAIRKNHEHTTDKTAPSQDANHIHQVAIKHKARALAIKEATEKAEQKMAEKILRHTRGRARTATSHANKLKRIAAHKSDTACNITNIAASLAEIEYKSHILHTQDKAQSHASKLKRIAAHKSNIACNATNIAASLAEIEYKSHILHMHDKAQSNAQAPTLAIVHIEPRRSTNTVIPETNRKRKANKQTTPLHTTPQLHDNGDRTIGPDAHHQVPDIVPPPPPAPDPHI